MKPAHLSTEEEFYETIDINLKSSFGVIRTAGKFLNEHPAGKYLPYKRLLEKYGKKYSWFN